MRKAGRIAAVVAATLIPLWIEAALPAEEPQADSKKVVKLVARGYSQLERGGHAAALDTFLEAEKRSPGGSFIVSMGLARARFALLNLESAGLSAETAIELAVDQRDLAEAATILGRIYYESAVQTSIGPTSWARSTEVGHDPRASTYLQQAIDASPLTANEARYYLARVLEDQGDYKSAKALLKTFLARWPSSPLAASARAHIAWMLLPREDEGEMIPEQVVEGKDMAPPVKLYAP